MGKLKYWSILSLTFAVVGYIFSLNFQDMAYWGRDGKFSWNWIWTGVILSYVFSLLSIIFIFTKIKSEKKRWVDIVLRIISLIIITATLLWTTFVVGMSG